MSVFLNAVGVVSPLGVGGTATRDALWSECTPDTIVSTDAYSPGRARPLGIVRADLPPYESWQLSARNRTNRLAAAALSQIRAPADDAVGFYGADRVAVVVGCSTSGVAEGERASELRRSDGAWPSWYHMTQQEFGCTAAFVASQLGTCGPAYVISTACSSGARALASGARLLAAGLVDAVIAGGADALCRFTVAGFSALESISDRRCNPLSVHRDGINLGEGAALFLMTREAGAVRLAGYGESADAYHLSAPAPDGRGAITAMRRALEVSGCEAGAVDYVNLHGTATAQNDAMEARAVHSVFGSDVPVSSTKPLTGHALAAAGAIEAAFAWLTLVNNPEGCMPVHWWDGNADPALPALHVVRPGERLNHPVRTVLSNSFAFGGSNACLLMTAA